MQGPRRPQTRPEPQLPEGHGEEGSGPGDSGRAALPRPTAAAAPSWSPLPFRAVKMERDRWAPREQKGTEVHRQHDKKNHDSNRVG